MLKTVKENKLLCLVWGMMLLLIALGVVSTTYLSLIAFILFIIYTIYAPLNYSYVLLFGLMPFANIFKLVPGGTSLFTVCEFFVVILSLFREKKISLGKFIPIMCLLIYIMISDIYGFNLFTILKLVLGFVLLYFALATMKKSDLKKIAYLLSVSVIAMLLLSNNGGYYSAVEPYVVELNYLVDSSGVTDVLRNGGFLGDPNYCAVLIMIAVALLTVLYFYNDVGNEFWLLILFLIPLGFNTYSKSYFLCVVAWILALIVLVLFKKNKVLAIMAIIVVSIITVLALSGAIEAINLVIKRFEDGDLTTGRMDLNQLYLQKIWESPKLLFFGQGVSVDRLVGDSHSVHNIYIEMLFRFGIVGTVIYLIVFFNSIKIIPKKGVYNVVDCLPLLFCLVMFFFLAGVTMYTVPFYMLISILSVKYNDLENNKKTKNIYRIIETRS